MTTTLIINTQEIPAKEMEEHHIRTRRKNGLSLSGTTTVALYILMTTVNSPSKLGDSGSQVKRMKAQTVS